MRIIRKIAFGLLVGPFVTGSAAFADPAPDRRYEPDEVFKDCRECPEMVVVPAVIFTMGSPESEEGRAKFVRQSRSLAPMR